MLASRATIFANLRGAAMDIAAWLRMLGLERYEQAFRDNDVDAKVLPHLTAEDLKEIGITSLGHRRSLLARDRDAPTGNRDPRTRTTVSNRAARR